MSMPSIGRIVHFIDASGEHLPAIIVALSNSDLSLTLAVFTPGGVQSGVTALVGDGPLTWHWPERE